jgi:hypothetical protein
MDPLREPAFPSGVVKRSTPVDAKMTPKHIHVNVLRKALKGRDQA